MRLIIILLFQVLFFNSTDNNDTHDSRDKIINWFQKDKILIPCIILNVIIIKPLNLIVYNYINNIRLYYCITQNKKMLQNYMIYHALFNMIFFSINPNSIGVIFFYAIILMTSWAVLAAGFIIIFCTNINYAYEYFSINNFTSRRIIPLQKVNQLITLSNRTDDNVDSDVESITETRL